MKRIKILFFILLFIPFFVCAETCDKNSITIKSIEIENKSDGANEKVKASVNNNNISLNLSMDEVSDVIEYKVIIKNTSKEDFIIDKNAFNKNNNYIKYTIYTEDDSNVIKGNSEKEVLLKVIYENEVPDDVLSDNKYNDNKNLVINLTNDKDGIINPYTGNINRVIILISVLLGGLFLYLFVNKKQPKLFILFILLLPLTISATCVTSINVESNVQINKKEVKPSILMQGSSTDEESNYLRTNIKKKNIETITFINSIGEHTVNGTTCFDVSRDEDGSVLAWVSDNDSDGLYEMTIGAKGKVYAVSGKNLFYELNNVTGMYGMEYFDTSLVTNMSNMFGYCFSLPSIDLSHFDTSNVTDISNMFSNFSSCETLDISSFDTSKVTNMSGMFSTEADGMKNSLKQIIGIETINTSNVTNMEWMFIGCEELTTLDLSNFDTSKVTKMNGMFLGCTNLKTIYANDNFDTSKVIESYDMFYTCYSIVGGNGTTYDMSHVKKEYARVDTDETPGYFTNKNSKTATIYYNSSNTLGELNIVSKKVSCVPSEGSSSCTITIPSVVTSSVGKYNSEFKGISDELDNLSNANLTINTNKVFYAYYSSEVTNYYYDNSYTNRTIYRNEYLTSLSDMNTVLSTSVSGTQSYSYSDGPGSSEWIGLSNEKDNIVEYNNVSDAALSGSNTLYSVYRFTVLFEKGLNVNGIGANSASCNVAIDETSCKVTLPTITYEDGYLTGGWNNTSGAKYGYEENSEYTNSSNNSKLYANAFITNYKNINTNVLYEVLTTAFNTANNGETIKVLQDYEESSITLSDGKDNIGLDLNGKKITLSQNSGIRNNGGLNIFDSSDGQGVIEGNTTIIRNYGNLNIKNIIIHGSLYNSIVNWENGNIVIEGSSTYIRSSLGIYNKSKLTIKDGLIESSSNPSIINEETGTLIVYGGTIQVRNSTQNTAISNRGIATLIGGTIISSKRSAISNYSNGILTIGTNDSIVNTDSPVIISNAQSLNYGIQNESGSTFNFYDGIIKAKSGTGSAIYGEVNDMPNGYQIYKETIDGVESAYLVKNAFLMEGDNGIVSMNYLRTNINRQNIENITFTNSLSNHTANGTDCFDVSKDNDGTVLAWFSDSDSNGLYEMTIGANGNIHLVSGEMQFYKLSNLKSINGMQYLDTSNVLSMYSMFDECSSLETIDLSHFDTSKVKNLSNMFRKCTSLTTLDVSHFDTPDVLWLNSMFYGCSGLTTLDVSSFITTNVRGMSSMFSGCSGLTTLDVSGFDTQNVTSLSGMFSHCSSLTTIDVSNFDTSNVISIYNMFSYCSSLTNIDLSHLNTSKVTSLSGIFEYCSSLTTVNLNNIDTSKVTNVSYMFQSCTSLTNLDLSNFDTSNVTSFRFMFDGCKNLVTLDLSNMNTSKATDIVGMFYGCKSLTNLDLSSFDTSNVKHMDSMFGYSSKITTIYVSDTFVTTSLTSSSDMFESCTSLVGGNGTIFNRSHIDKEYAHIDEGESNPGYFTDYRVKEATIIYNSNNSFGELTVSTTKVRCTASEGDSCTITLPSEVTNSIGKYNGTFKGLSNSLSNMNSSTLSINKPTTLYAIYQSEVTNHYYDNEYTTRTLYRNEYFSSGSEMDVVLSISETGSENYNIEAGPGSSEWIGLSINQDTSLEFNNIIDAAKSNNNTFYSVYRFNVTFEKGSNVNEIGSTSASCDVTSSDSSCSIVLPSIIVSPGYKSVGWNTTNGATTGNDALTLYFVTENNKALYANAINSMLMQESRSSYSNYLNTSILRNNIETITFTNSIGNHTVNGTDCFDVSKEKNGTVLAWTEDSDENELFELTIGSNGKTYASNGKYLFFALKNLKNINGLEYLDTSLITSAEEMFAYDEKLESLDVSHFDTSKVTTIANMFHYCELLTSLDLSNFDTLNVTNMSYLFSGCSSLTNLNISVFNTSKVTSMHGMFSGCYSLTDIDLSHFDTSNVKSMNYMFNGCKALTSIDLSHINTSNVTNMSNMFSNCENLTNIDLSHFDTSKVTDMSYMFAGCENLTSIDVSPFVTSQVTTMSDMFSDCEKITTLNLENFDTSKVTNMRNMFSNCINLTSINLSSFNTSKVRYMTSMFYNCSKLSSLDLSNFNTSNVISMGAEYNNNSLSSYTGNGMFEGCSSLTTLDLSSFSTEKLTHIGRMFRNCKNLITLILGDFKNTNVEYMTEVFYGCQSLTALDLSNFKTDKAINMHAMFYNCKSIAELDLRSFNTSNVTDMVNMFSICSNLTTLNLSSFDTSNVTSMSTMFSGCSSLTTLDLKNFDTSKVTSFVLMFNSCKNLISLDISNFNTSNVTNMKYMFYDCISLTELDLSSFDTSKVTTMEEMFHSCKNLVTIYASNNFVTINTNCNYMFSGCTSLIGGNGTVYNSSNSERLYARIDTPETPGYFTAH